MRVAEILQETNMPEYSQALLSAESRKTCTNLAKSINKSHDFLYQSFRDSISSKDAIRNELIKIAQKELSGDAIYLIFDDSQLSKPYAKDIEGLDVSFDGCSGHAELGLQMITALMTDGRIKLPIDLMPYISKQLAGSYFKTKSEIAAGITAFFIELFKIDLILADAHYATKFFLPFLYKIGANFLMKIPCNRIVTIGKSSGQLKKILRLRKNERVRSVQGFFDGLPYYFYVVKIKDGSIAYFISLNSINPYKIVELYKIRWNIELYHRTAKQSLGWKDCQMRAIEKQELHSFYVMYAYAIADIIRFKLKLRCTEEAIRLLWDVKQNPTNLSFFASGENLC